MRAFDDYYRIFSVVGPSEKLQHRVDAARSLIFFSVYVAFVLLIARYCDVCITILAFGFGWLPLGIAVNMLFNLFFIQWQLQHNVLAREQFVGVSRREKMAIAWLFSRPSLTGDVCDDPYC